MFVGLLVKLNNDNYDLFKGIVSRDWAELEMILLDRLEVFNISTSHFFFFAVFIQYF